MSLFSRLKKSEYARHSTILMTGTVISMILQTVSFAWLGNYYNDTAMGLYQYLNTAYSILLIAATGRYELSVMLPQDDNDGYLLALLSAGASILFSCLLEAGVLAAQFVFGVDPDWFAFLPVTLAVLGIYYSCNYWLNRTKRYVKLAINRVLQGVLFVFFNISYAFVLPDRRYGLILGYLSAQIVVMLILVVYMAMDYRKYRIRFSFARIHELAVDYIKFPKYSVPAGIVNNLAMHLPVFLLGALSGSSVVGQYTMMNKVLGAPITVISEAIRDVFRQKASRDYAQNGECRVVYRTTGKTLALAAIAPFVLLMMGAVPVFSAIFGDKWKMAAYFIVMMSPFYYVKFVVSPLTFMAYIAERQNFDMKWQIGFCLSSAAAFLIGYFVWHNPYIMMLCFGAAQTVLYLYSFFYTRRLSRGEAESGKETA